MNNLQIIENVLIQGDLSSLNNEQRVSYYNKTCDSLGLNPLTKPFDYIKLNNKLVLYAKRDATDQLRSLRKVSVKIVGREQVGDVFIVTAQASTPDGRTDESVGAVTVGNLKGDHLANALMKAETKAKRRVTLSICGLGILDETELATIPNVAVPAQTQEVLPPQKTKLRAIEPIETNEPIEQPKDWSDKFMPSMCPSCGAEGRPSKYDEGKFYCSDYKNGCKAKW